MAVSFYLSREEVERGKRKKEREKDRKKELSKEAKEVIVFRNDVKTRNFLVIRTNNNVIYETVESNTIFSVTEEN